jgi:hypothetical protein
MAGGEQEQAGGSALPPQTTSQRLIDLGFQALPAIGGAIGFVGLVAVAGAVIQWFRFWAVGLPADQAVSVIPRPELVAIGAGFLIVYTLLGLLGVLMTYLLDSRDGVNEATRWGLVLVAAVEIAAAFVFAELPWWGYVAAAAWIVALATLSVAALTRAARRLNELRSRAETRERLRQLATAAVEARAEAAEADVAQATRALYDALVEAPAAAIVGPLAATRMSSSAPAAARSKGYDSAAEAERPEARYSPEELLEILEQRSEAVSVDNLTTLTAPLVERIEQIRRDDRFGPTLGALVAGAVIIAATAILAPGAYWLIPVWATALLVSLTTLSAPTALFAVFAAGIATLCHTDDTVWLIPIVAVAAVLALMNLGFAAATKRFAWYAVGVFLSVPLFGAILTVARTLETPKIQPVAVVRASDENGVCGIYVTETDDRVYLARVKTEPSDDPDDPAKAAAGTGSMLWIATDKVDVVEVGTLVTLEYADRRARQLLAQAYDDRAAQSPTGPSVEVTTKDGDVTTVRKEAQPPLRPVERPQPDVRERQLCTGGRAVPDAPEPEPRSVVGG